MDDVATKNTPERLCYLRLAKQISVREFVSMSDRLLRVLLLAFRLGIAWTSGTVTAINGADAPGVKREVDRDSLNVLSVISVLAR